MPADALFDRDTLGFDEWTRTPQPAHVVPDQIKRERERRQFRDALRDDPAAVVITHTDADGLSSAALIADYCGPDTTVRPIDYHGALQFEHVVEDLTTTGGLDLSTTAIYVCDFNHEPVDRLGVLASRARRAEWFDHHQWDDATAEAVIRAGFDLLVDEDECTASLLVERDDALPDAEFEPYLEELAAVTKDIDLWIREDPRSERLNVFASIADPEEYVETVLAHGVDFPDDVETRIDERQARDQELERAAVDRCQWTTIDGHRVALAYSRGGRSSEIGNTLAEAHDPRADIAVVLKTHGGIGIYAHSNRETFARCHEVAAELGGGGHPTAAGCSAPADTFRELAEYWSTAGRSVHWEICEAIEAVVGGED